MKNIQFLIFISIVLTIYSLGNIYIFLKGYNILPPPREHKLLFTILFVVLSLTFVAAKILESRHSSVFTDILNIIGGFWMAFMLYSILFLLLSDLIAVSLKIPGILNSNNIMVYRKWAFLSASGISVILIVYGFINALHPAVTKYDITINKEADEIKTLRIAAVSDIHLGSIIRKRSIKILSEMLEDIPIIWSKDKCEAKNN